MPSTWGATLSLLAVLSSVAQGTRRIVGGKPVPAKDPVPWIVSLEAPDQLNRMVHYCGATLISPEWIVSAAHCFDVPFANDLVCKKSRQSILLVSLTHLFLHVLKAVPSPAGLLLNFFGLSPRTFVNVLQYTMGFPAPDEISARTFL